MSKRAGSNSTDNSQNEIDKRRDDALRRALTTPPKPHVPKKKDEAKQMGKGFAK